MKVIYPLQSGGIAITYELDGWDMVELGKLTTPYGVPFKVVRDSDLPADWSTSEAWEADFSRPDGIGMGPHRYHVAKAEAEIAVIDAAQPPEDADEKTLIAFAMERQALLEQRRQTIALMKAEVLQNEGVQL